MEKSSLQIIKLIKLQKYKKYDLLQFAIEIKIIYHIIFTIFARKIEKQTNIQLFNYSVIQLFNYSIIQC